MLLLLHPMTGLFDLCTGVKPEVFWRFFAMEEVAQDVDEAIFYRVYVLVNFLSQFIFIFRLVFGYSNEC